MGTVKSLSVIGWMHEYGVSVVFMALVTVLLFAYFWKVINARPEAVIIFDSVKSSLEQIVVKIHNLEILIAKLEAMFSGDFRNRGGRND